LSREETTDECTRRRIGRIFAAMVDPAWAPVIRPVEPDWWPKLIQQSGR
jgi:hypothetical protein